MCVATAARTAPASMFQPSRRPNNARTSQRFVRLAAAFIFVQARFQQKNKSAKSVIERLLPLTSSGLSVALLEESIHTTTKSVRRAWLLPRNMPVPIAFRAFLANTSSNSFARQFMVAESQRCCDPFSSSARLMFWNGRPRILHEFVSAAGNCIIADKRNSLPSQQVLCISCKDWMATSEFSRLTRDRNDRLFGCSSDYDYPSECERTTHQWQS